MNALVPYYTFIYVEIFKWIIKKKNRTLYYFLNILHEYVYNNICSHAINMYSNVGTVNVNIYTITVYFINISQKGYWGRKWNKNIGKFWIINYLWCRTVEMSTVDKRELGKW